MQTVNANDSVSGSPDLRSAIRFALATGAGAVAGLGAQQAVAQTAPAAKAADNQGLEEIVVTGTRIRRVDAEGASPILTINSETIAASGVQTVGELVSQLPTVAGAAINPAVNNGGGFGEANVELRGLDAKRTLVLLNGRRVGLVGASGAVDVNQIPINMIDHVEVLKEGAGAIYGSDAIAGVVNFITKTKSDGLELSGEYGMTSRNDGEHESLSALFGTSSDKMDFTMGGSYTRQKQVSAGDREYSRLARYLYSGLYATGTQGPRTQFEVDAGSSRIPNGRVSIGASSALVTLFGGCNKVTRKDGAAGTSLTDYRCYHASSDAFNYQPYNLLMTPQERGSMFSTVNYRVTDNTEIYAEVLMNRTHSGYEIAPLPFDATSDNVIVSKDNIYNPFGLDFGGQTTLNGNFRLRLYTLGDRFSQTTSDSKLVTTGVKGKLFGTDWRWDADLSYGRLDQSAKVNGYIFFPDLAKAVGPSFIDPVNGPTCGTPTNPIANCTPMNIFNESDPATLAQLRAMSTDYKTDNTFTTKAASFNVNGKVATLPAGDMQAALGFEYRDLATVFEADHLVVAQPPLYINCIISQEACTGPSAASYDDKELYGELFVPILKDAPGAKALNLDIGVRYSKYSEFGATTKGQFKLEYRPVSDLLLRGTYAQVYRVPTLADLAAAPTASNPTYKDPCYGLDAAAIALKPNLALVCAGVAQDHTFKYNGTSQISAIILSNPDLKPESGNVITYGFVLQIPHVRNWSVSVDSWRYELNDLITPLDPNYVSDQCLATGAAKFCGLINRLSAGVNQGEIEAFLLPTVNLGTLKTEGTDVGTKYQLKGTRAGDFQFSLDTTYISTYENSPGNGAPPQEVAGTYNNQFGNYARVRAMGSIGWAKGNMNALLTGRYIHHLVVHNPATQSGAVLGLPEPDLKIPSVTYFDLTLGYNIKGSKTKLQLGVLNLADKQPPIFYQNNTINADTNVETYDTLGRRYFLTFNQKF
jgi:outer membrane receptor protein involved in Fe transport